MTFSLAVLCDASHLVMVELGEGGCWSTIGGGVDANEGPADADRREAAEEVQLAVELRGIVEGFGGPDSLNHDADGHWVDFIASLYAASPVSEVLATTEGEMGATGWLDGPGIAALGRPQLDPPCRRRRLRPAVDQ